MEYLIKQTKGKTSGQSKSSAAAERRVSVQRTESYKDRRRVWFGRRSSSRRIDLDLESDTMGIDQATAVAAAAYAIAATERPSFPERKWTFMEGTQSSLSRMKSERQGSLPVRHLEETDSDEDYYDTAPATPVVTPVSSMKKNPSFVEKPVSSMKKKPTFVEKPVPNMEKLPASTEMQLNNNPSFTEKPVSSMKKKPSFVEKPVPTMEKLPASTEMEDDGKRKAKTADSQTELPHIKPETPMAKPDATLKPAIPTNRASGRAGTVQTAADAWEKVEFEKLREKYEFENEQIDKWENEKKANAKRRLDKAEGSDRTRMKALERYRSDVDTITQIAEEARASTAKKQRRDELKVKEKANLYRRTGKVPRTTCSCF
ncbi:Uncharacterized protein At3g61260 [Linum perenne]